MALRLRLPALLLLIAAFAALLALQEREAVLAGGPDFVVDDTGDAGDDDTTDGDCDTAGGVCTLRAAIEQANAGGDPVVIGFNIAGDGPHVLEPESPLPAVTVPAFIDGSTEPSFIPNKAGRGNFLGDPVVEINGASAGKGADGLVLEGGAVGEPDDEGYALTNGFRSLIIRAFDGEGAVFQVEDGGSAMDSLIGINDLLDITGNGGTGILIDGVSFVLVENNFVCRNRGDGVGITGATATNNVVRHNWIGATLQTLKGNSFNGVYIESGTDNLVGGGADDGNVIVDNGQDGVRIQGTLASGNVVSGNSIGFVLLTADRGKGPTGANEGNGVALINAYQNIVGGEEAGQGNLISRNVGSGVYIEGKNAFQNSILGNLIGTDSDGEAANPNLNGVLIDAAPGNLVSGNLISGNTDNGIEIVAGASSTEIVDNVIGLASDGATALGNGNAGVLMVEAGDGNMVGTVDEGNVISGNGEAGVWVVETPGAEILNNYIGTNEAGSLAVANGGNGVFIVGSSSATVGEVDSGNVISGNVDAGIALVDGSSATVIQANIIGLDATGDQILAQATGIRVADSPSNLLGGTGASDGNVIGGHTGPGIEISGVASAGNSVYGNYVGTDIAGALERANATGILIDGAPSNNIGQDALTGASNVISGNEGDGVHISGPTATDNTLRANYIGLTAGGDAALGNDGHGVSIVEAPGNTVGAANAGAGNVISANAGDGVHLDTSADSEITNNLIGLIADGTSMFGNGGSGVTVESSSGAVVGGVAGNTISGNAEYGVTIADGSASAEITANTIGADITGLVDAGNVAGGIHVYESMGTQIGAVGDGNSIVGNGGPGIYLEGATGSAIWANQIGVAWDGTTALGNGGAGVLVDNSAAVIASDNSIGDLDPLRGNVIKFNEEEGVAALGGIDNAILSNSIDENGALGIDLYTVGVTPNDEEDSDTGPNGLQNFPDLTEATVDDGLVEITGTLNSTPGTAFTLQFFASEACDPSGYGEGARLLGTAAGVTDLDGNAAIEVSFAAKDVSEGDAVTATATDPLASTSEFSQCVEAENAEPEADLVIDKQGSPEPVTAGDNLTYVITVNNNGPDTATAVTVTDDLPDEVSFVSATPSEGECEGTDVVTCELGEMASGAEETVTIVVEAVTPGEVQNTASVSATETDPNPDNNSATAMNNVTQVQADLGINKQLALPGEFEVGDVVSYLITVGNDGPDAATDVEVVDDLPAGVALVSAVPSVGSCGNTDPVTCTLGNLAEGQVETVTIVVRVLQAGTVLNTATVSGAEADPEPADNSSSASVDVAPLEIVLFEGWNLIDDFPAEDVSGVDAVIQFFNANVEPVSWHAVAYYTGAAWLQTFLDAPLPSFNTLTFIQTGDDIWIFVTTEATLSFEAIAP
jgi:uncharacterized repeat protein (TIGR01451 family)/CSLREA domain-containing protein